MTPSASSDSASAVAAALPSYPRDLRGHGRHPPHAQWPNQARVAVQFVLNYEEGGENSVLHGDAGSEQFLSEMFNPPAFPARHLSMEGIYEYGSRVGVWRILREFEKRGLPLTVFGVSMALERCPEVTAAFVELGHEIACHGWRWIHYQNIDGALAPHLVVPYTLDCNDMRFALPQGYSHGDPFFQYLKDAFDVHYAEGEEMPSMMSIGLHCRLLGRPGRMRALQRFLDYIQGHDRVWITRRIDIANHWRTTHPFDASTAFVWA